MNKNVKVVKEVSVLGMNVKIYGTTREPLFLAKDVAEWIGARDTYSVTRKVDVNDKKYIKCLLMVKKERYYL